MHGAVNGVTRILESAHREPSVKNFVFMSSVVAIISSKRPHRFTEKDWNTEAEAIVAKLGKEAPSKAIYSASKTAAEKAFWKFRDDKRPQFTMTTVNPW
jgi:nucleoside-diphosphate-sugar epimerase